MMALQPTKKRNISDLENVGQGHHLQTTLYLSYYMTDFYQTFIEIMTMWSATKMSYQLTLKMLVKVTIYKNRISAITQQILTKLLLK